jgi:hypothetical protein
LDESFETAVHVLRVGVPDVVPISRFVEVMDHFCSFVETLGDERDIEVVIGIFQESGCAPEATNENEYETSIRLCRHAIIRLIHVSPVARIGKVLGSR